MLQRVKDYNESQAINQSRLKKLLGNEDPQIFLSMETSIDTKSITIGSLVDCLITSPEEYLTDYYISELESLPTDSIQAIVTETFSHVSQTSEEPISDDIKDYVREMLLQPSFETYQANWKVETKIKKLVGDGETLGEGNKFWRELVLSRGKKIISKANDELAHLVKDSLLNNFSSWFREEELYINRFFQYPIYFKKDDIECKALIDMLLVNHQEKTVYVIDLKTMSGNTLSFPDSVKSFGYNLQMAFYYWSALSLTKPGGLYEEYDIKCGFIVESTTNIGQPLLYMCTQDFIEVGLYGIDKRLLNSDSLYPLIFKEQEGIVHLLNKYKYYINNGFEKNQRIVANNSKFTLDWFGIV